MMNLNDTVEMMQSEDYKEQFKAEYYQTKIRFNKLRKILVQREAGTLGYELETPVEILQTQMVHMNNYMHLLEIRAELEKIELEY